MKLHPLSHTNNCNHTKQKSLVSQAVDVAIWGSLICINIGIISAFLQAYTREQQNAKHGPVCDRINNVTNQTDVCPIDIFNKYIYTDGSLNFNPYFDFHMCWFEGKLNSTNTTLLINNCECNQAALKDFVNHSSYLNKDHPRYNPNPKKGCFQRFSDLNILSKLGCTLELKVEKVCKEVVTGSFLTEQRCSDEITDLVVAKARNTTFWD